MEIKNISKKIKEGKELTIKQFERWVKARKIKDVIWSKKYFDLNEDETEVIHEYWSVFADGTKVFVEG